MTSDPSDRSRSQAPDRRDLGRRERCTTSHQSTAAMALGRGPPGPQDVTCPGPPPALPLWESPMLSPPRQPATPEPIAAPAADVVVAPLLDLDPDLAGDLTPALREQVRGWLA